MPDSLSFSEIVGLVKIAKIEKVNIITGELEAKLISSGSNLTRSENIRVKMPIPLWHKNGTFIGGYPSIDTLIVVAQGSGNEWFFVSYYSNNPTLHPEIKEEELLITTKPEVKILLNKNSIQLGSNKNYLKLNSVQNLQTSVVDNTFNFSQTNKTINSLIKREHKHDPDYTNANRLYSEEYYLESLKFVGFDPTASINLNIRSKTKNPPLVEQKEVIYEFPLDANIKDDLTEFNNYNNSATETDFSLPNRKTSKADALSLSLFEPNYLMESIKGTVVDIFGNVLDLNRLPLELGREKNTFREDGLAEKSEVYRNLRNLHRRGIAFHYEMNARKDVLLPDINSSTDYAKNRSRFFIDIDKEGQFKLNVPASSETGNVPVLTRYENYSYLGQEDNQNPNKIFFREDDRKDILHDSFNQGVIEVKNNDAVYLPTDRLSGNIIKHGTAYHDITKTCLYSQSNETLAAMADEGINLEEVTTLSDVVSKTINLGTQSPNAGGRSGQANFDGSLEINIGANTVDRQSLWMDLAGGMVSMIGRDKNNNSLISGMDGNVWIQIGGLGVTTDSRFPASRLPGGDAKPGSLDIRVMTTGGHATLIRIDDTGVKIVTPSRITLHSDQDMNIVSKGSLHIDAENMYLNQREVLKFGPSI